LARPQRRLTSAPSIHGGIRLVVLGHCGQICLCGGWDGERRVLPARSALILREVGSPGDG
jgi:hypothetical protein